MGNEDRSLEEVAQDDGVRLAVMKVLYAIGLGDEVMVELLGDVGVDPVMVEEDLEQIKRGITPGDKPFPTALKALATIFVTGQYANLKPEELSLLTELLGDVISADAFIVFSRGAVCYALSKTEVQGEGNIEVDLGFEEVFGAVFRLILEPSLDAKHIPQDEDDLQFILLQQVDTMVDTILTANGYSGTAPDRPADGPLTGRSARTVEDDA